MIQQYFCDRFTLKDVNYDFIAVTYNAKASMRLKICTATRTHQLYKLLFDPNESRGIVRQPLYMHLHLVGFLTVLQH